MTQGPDAHLRPDPIIVCSHGTDDPQGRRTVAALVDRVADLLPGRQVRVAHVDVQQPELADVVAQVAAQGVPPVVVPLLLSTGFHVQVDIAEAVAAHPGTLAAEPLGPDQRLVDALQLRLTELGTSDDDTVVLAAAGSSRPQAAVAVEQVAGWLGERRGSHVVVGYCSADRPDVQEAVQAARARHSGPGRVVLASYLLGEGFFQRRLRQAGADMVSAPLGAQSSIARIVVDRARAAQRLAGDGDR